MIAMSAMRTGALGVLAGRAPTDRVHRTAACDACRVAVDWEGGAAEHPDDEAHLGALLRAGGCVHGTRDGWRDEGQLFDPRIERHRELAGDGWRGAVGGFCPTQGFGSVGDLAWYFRSRWDEWTLDVGPEDVRHGGYVDHDAAVWSSAGDGGHAVPEAAALIAAQLARYLADAAAARRPLAALPWPDAARVRDLIAFEEPELIELRDAEGIVLEFAWRDLRARRATQWLRFRPRPADYVAALGRVLPLVELIRRAGDAWLVTREGLDGGARDVAPFDPATLDADGPTPGALLPDLAGVVVDAELRAWAGGAP